MSLYGSFVPLDEAQQPFTSFNSNWIQNAPVPSEPEYVLVRVPVVNGVPQYTFSPNTATEKEPLTDIHRALRIIPLVIAPLVIILWGLTCGIGMRRYYYSLGPILLIVVAALATLFACYQIPVSFFGGKKLRVGFWIAVPLAVCYFPLIIVAYIAGDFIGAPVATAIFGLHVAWTVVCGLHLGRVCSCCKQSDN